MHALSFGLLPYTTCISLLSCICLLSVCQRRNYHWQGTAHASLLVQAYEVSPLLYRYDYANKAALDLFEATWEELIGQPSSSTTEDVGQVGLSLHLQIQLPTPGHWFKSSSRKVLRLYILQQNVGSNTESAS